MNIWNSARQNSKVKVLLPGMKDYSKKTSKKYVRFRTPSLYKANKAEYSQQKFDHLKGNKSVQRSGYSVKG